MHRFCDHGYIVAKKSFEQSYLYRIDTRKSGRNVVLALMKRENSFDDKNTFSGRHPR